MEYTFDATLHEVPENGGAYVIASSSMVGKHAGDETKAGI